ncbi:Chitinase II [Akanthomyces lecanii RCEF 1005]|uniref:chitinase n=1 Tax=Akanthomyces lecanii RCEF 1005 TaxID=1081108 RepID=A0A168GXK7_CORDF|nr:Chitinase II [Akanthomyces lecanii RCEF 1005]
MKSQVRIAYYNAEGAKRKCDAVQPENIPAGVLTHINVAFEGISSDLEMTDTIGETVARVSRLKKIYAGLRVNIAIGGWVFNDPPTEHRFSDMVATYTSQRKFISSLIKYMQKYALDGVDIDWEYPVADDRGGNPDDMPNFVTFMSQMRDMFDSVDPGWQITLTLPSSYWYMRGFDIKQLEEYVDWFNMMTYDIHGVWDEGIRFTGPYLKGHTNISEIEDGLDLLWRNKINHDKVVMGYGFYGRGFHIKDPNCHTPPNCEFDGPSLPGSCTDTAGILSYSEIQSRKNELGTTVTYDEDSTVKYMIYGSNQWISFDDAESFKDKKKYQSSRCLKGLMIWSVDLDNSNFDAMSGLFGDENMSKAHGDASLTDKEKGELVKQLAPYTGQNCYISTKCASSARDTTSGATCFTGYKPVEMAHAPRRIRSDKREALETCKEGKFHYICCPEDQMPKNCEWIGAPERSEIGCSGFCGKKQFQLATDSYIDYKGTGSCYQGRRSLCCDSTDFFDDCWWSDCGDWNENCGSSGKVLAWRLDEDDGYPLENCFWSNDIRLLDPPDGGDKQYSDSYADFFTCNNKECPYYDIKVTKALIPHTSIDWINKDSIDCSAYPQMNNVEPEYGLCCNPPNPLKKKLPVDPSFLWSDPHKEDGSENVWEFADDFGNNNQDTTPDNQYENPGSDPYGFIMLNGPDGSLNDNFGKDFTVVSEKEPDALEKRSLLTTNRTILDNVFEDAPETIHVYCNHAPDSRECRRTFYKGAEDTIIRLPDHVGEGPFARIVSMERVDLPQLPSWVHRKRTIDANRNGVYELKFDYNFGAIKRADDEQVNMRVDFTNLMDYWDDVTDEPTGKSKKRSKRDYSKHMGFDEWKARVDQAKKRDLEEAGLDEHIQSRRSFTPEPHDVSTHAMERRWYGAFKEWLKKLNSIVKDEKGFLPMGWSSVLTLYSGRLECESDAGISFQAGLDVTADFDFDMRTQYAYYFSGTIVPPKIIDTYAYVGAHPYMEAGITVAGEAHLGYTSDRKKIIDTLTYPGLAIKGIASIGPSLDIWGQIKGEVTVAGSMRVGARYTFKPIELYMPNDDETRSKASSDLEKNDGDEEGLSPVFEAEVEASVGFGVLVTPEVNLGLKLGGGIGKFKKTLVDAHVAAFVNTTLWFYANAKAQLEKGWSYKYGVKFYYRVGFSAIVEAILIGTWKTDNYYPFEEQVIDIYGPVEVSSSDTSRKRQLHSSPGGPLPRPLFELPASEFGSVRRDLPKFDGPGLFQMGANMSANGTYRGGQDASMAAAAADDGKTEEGSFKFGDFTCVTGGLNGCTAATIPPDPEVLSSVDMAALNKSESAAPEVGIAKRAAASKGECPEKLPKLYYNCVSYFSDYTLLKQKPRGKSTTMPGICNSVQKFLNNRNGQPNSRGTKSSWTLTWDSKKERANRRRGQSCPTKTLTRLGFCEGDNSARRRAAWGDPKLGRALTNCDEFPFASSEEGGSDFYGLYPSVATGTARTCVPSWQNDQQGLCNKLLSGLDTNIVYYNNRKKPESDATKAEWKNWGPGEDGWVQAGWGKKQRVAQYAKTNLQAHSAGISAALAYPKTASATSPTFPGLRSMSGNLFAGKSYTPRNKALKSMDNVICAVSTNGQNRFRSNSVNGYCWDGVQTRKKWGGLIDVIVAFSCRLSFKTTGKRDQIPIGFLGDEPVYGIEKVEGTEIEMELPQGVELGTDGDTAESAMLDDVDDASSDNTSFTERDIDVWEDVLGEEGGSSWDADIADVVEHSLAGKE